jgi:hypothetical protein
MKAAALGSQSKYPKIEMFKKKKIMKMIVEKMPCKKKVT